MNVRRDTAAAAALSLTSRIQKEDENPTENNQDTSIDDILGPRALTDREGDMSDESSQRTTSPSDSGSNSIQAQSPEPEATLVSNEEAKTDEESEIKEADRNEGEGERSESNPMESNELVENQINSNGTTEVVTSVTVEVSGNGEAAVAVCDENMCKFNKETLADNDEEATGSSNAEGESQEAKDGEASEKNGESTLAPEQAKQEGEEEGVEVLITHDQRSNSFSVNVANIDTDDYSSSEDESSQPPPFVEPPSEATTSSAVNATPTQEVTSSEEPPMANGDCPTITVETAEGGKGPKDEEGKDKRSGSESSSEGEKLSPPPERRRSKFLMATALHVMSVLCACVFYPMSWHLVIIYFFVH